jgi:orotidine-5'-phosphate decarboxylase
VSHFGDRLAAAVEARESNLVLGLDPDPALLWPGCTDVAGHCAAVIEAAAGACVAVKPQVACFERLGAEGWEALAEIGERARAAGLLVIADAKRGDVPVTARVYAEAFFDRLRADALTVNPLLGRDALAPLLDAARRHGGGIFVLVRTSNPGAADLFDLELAGGEALWERVAALVAALGVVGERGLADVGAVTGATEPRHLERMRELMPATPFLLPGVGAQGGRVESLGPAFSPGLAGGLVTASRAIALAHQETGGAPAEAARAAAEGLRAAAMAAA